MTLYMSNGGSFAIKMTREFKRNENGEAEGKTTYYLNDEEVEDDYITIVTTDKYDDIIWDYTPMTLDISVVNDKGEDLLDKSVDGNILDNEITITYDGNTYGLGKGAEPIVTRECLAVFDGLTHYDSPYGNNYLSFGEFAAYYSYDMDLTLDLGTGKTYDLRYVHNFEHIDLLEQPTIENEAYVDGELMDYDKFVIEL
ncbi:MAG: hypothetical protein R3Y08_03750 [Rikenellaceae bacterium]